MKPFRFALALAAPLLLASCLLTPGKFVSTLHIGKDRSFTFTYAGEVILLDPAQEMAKGVAEGVAEGIADAAAGEDDSSDSAHPPETPAPAAASEPVEETAAQLADRKALAEALSKEVGYRSVEYLGQNKYRVDYAMTGRLDRSFVYPVNLDAMAIIPWLAIEVRKDGTARVKAMAFGDPDTGMGGMAGMGGNSNPAEKDKAGREGTFTLTTDAALVMQNNEEGLAPGPGTRIVWKVTPATKTVPTAVVRFGP
jgi:hypothetical protein